MGCSKILFTKVGNGMNFAVENSLLIPIHSWDNRTKSLASILGILFCCLLGTAFCERSQLLYHGTSLWSDFLGWAWNQIIKSLANALGMILKRFSSRRNMTAAGPANTLILAWFETVGQRQSWVLILESHKMLARKILASLFNLLHNTMGSVYNSMQ